MALKALKAFKRKHNFSVSAVLANTDKQINCDAKTLLGVALKTLFGASAQDYGVPLFLGIAGTTRLINGYE